MHASINYKDLKRYCSLWIISINNYKLKDRILRQQLKKINKQLLFYQNWTSKHNTGCLKKCKLKCILLYESSSLRTWVNIGMQLFPCRRFKNFRAACRIDFLNFRHRFLLGFPRKFLTIAVFLNFLCEHFEHFYLPQTYFEF